MRFQIVGCTIFCCCHCRAGGEIARWPDFKPAPEGTPYAYQFLPNQVGLPWHVRDMPEASSTRRVLLWHAAWVQHCTSYKCIVKADCLLRLRAMLYISIYALQLVEHSTQTTCTLDQGCLFPKCTLWSYHAVCAWPQQAFMRVMQAYAHWPSLWPAGALMYAADLCYLSPSQTHHTLVAHI